MNSLQQAQANLKTLIEKTTDKDTLKELATLNATLDNAIKEHDTLAKDLKETQASYKELIIHGSVTDKDSRAEQIGDKKEKSFEECANEFFKNKNTKK